jgi:hypothetical protein
MNKTPEKNIQIGNNIIDLNEISAITFVERELSEAGPRIFFKFKSNHNDLQINFDNQESFYMTKSNLKRIMKPLDITIEIKDPPADNYLKHTKDLLQD